ncbi:MAG: succinate dehydrogenase iron-sulfur subunit [Acidobacteriota bacterium]
MAIEKNQEIVEAKIVKFKVFRFSSEESDEPSFKIYEIPVKKGMTVLDGLIHIKENLDSTLNFRYSCRMGVCGSCGMFINGLPALGCHTQISHLNSDIVEVKPLPNYYVIRDIVPDFNSLFQKHKSVKPFIIREHIEELGNPTSEYFQTEEEKELISQFTYCIKCGVCSSACPTLATDSEFLGPQAISQAYRYSADTRDEGFLERIKILDSSHGCWRCHFASSCSQVCPKGVDPAFASQLIKREILLMRFGLKKKRKGAPITTLTKEVKRLEEIPEPPKRTLR